jgi:tetratricopeptide (TPR) repeat protein
MKRDRDGRSLPLKSHALLLAGAVFLSASADAASVKVHEENIVLPAYLAGAPEPNPMFYFGRNSQGAEGRVYPYPLYDALTDVKSNQTYRIVYLENEYVRIGVLPEIGGRLFEAVDKSNGYNWVYRQHVIKPALIGLIGAWMSGGVEWNIPHHHRATTFLPVQHRLEENPDGSKTVWVGELELRHRMRWAVGYTLSPGKSCLTAQVRIVNRTPFAQTMLCFANLAVHVNENYQVIFPPSTQLVTYHGKRGFATWPIATGRYAGADFGSGTDVSWYKNHTNANSMFAWNCADDFFAGYDHGQQAGTMSVADHHVVPGKKFWTWGSGPRGRMWDKILTDNDGPYIELMTGAYSDNQPDYSWLQPFETKSFEMHWYPFRDIGGVKNANLEAAVNLEVTNGVSKIGFCTTAAHRNATVHLKRVALFEERGVLIRRPITLLEEKIFIHPGKPFVKQVALPAGLDEHDLRASLFAEGRELIVYSPVRLGPVKTPEPVTPPPSPRDISTLEELYLAGQRIEQFHDPGREPEPYWEEALRRDGGDARVNLALGIRKLKQARFAEAEQHFRKSIERLTAQYTTPRDGEPFYYLGMALKAQGKHEEAFDAFFKATWSEAWRGPAYYALAEIATRRGEFPIARDYVERSLNANALNLRAYTLKTAILRHLGAGSTQVNAYLAVAAHTTDPLDVRLMAERWLGGDKLVAGELSATLRGHPETGLEAATEYGNAGLWQDGAAILTKLVDAANGKSRVLPLAYYYLGQFAERLGNQTQAVQYRQLAVKASPDYCFPFQWEAIHVLRRAMEANPQDARAPYYLGNLLFDWQPDEAVKLWEQSAALDPSFSIVHRNLAVACAHQATAGDVARAVAELERAVSLPEKYAMHFAELDELYADAARPPLERLALLERNHQVVSKRDDALSREIGLKVFAGKYDEAIQLMKGRKFSVWEGGTLDVAEHWVNAHLLRGRAELTAGQFAAALADFHAANSLPDNLPSERGAGRGREAELNYWIGVAHEAMSDNTKAKQSWQDAAVAPEEGRVRRGVGSGLSDRSAQNYYRALAQRRLGQNTEAESTLRALLEAANRALERDAIREASPATAEERRSPPVGAALAHYLAGLGHLGLGETEEARQAFTLALQSRPDHLDAKTELAHLESGTSSKTGRSK